MSARRKLKGKQPPEGWDLIEDVIEDFEAQMKEAVNEEHEVCHARFANALLILGPLHGPLENICRGISHACSLCAFRACCRIAQVPPLHRLYSFFVVCCSSPA